MIDKSVFNFLKDLSDNNNRDWFNDNKKVYEAARENVEAFVQKLVERINKFDNDIEILPAKKYLFRIYRDVRFAKDKSPYKTNFGAYINKGGRKGPYAGYYFHIEPDNSFLGGGVYKPMSQYLKAIREEVFQNTAEFKKIIESKAFKETFGQIEGEKLSRPPKGFPKDLELLKYKSYTVWQLLEDKKLQSDDFLEYSVGVFRNMQDFNNFLNRAVSKV